MSEILLKLGIGIIGGVFGILALGGIGIYLGGKA